MRVDKYHLISVWFRKPKVHHRREMDLLNY